MTASIPGAIAFDLDDTLYPERDFVISGYAAVAATVRPRFGVDILPALTARFLAGERGDLFTPVLAAAGHALPEAEIRELVEVYRGHRPALSPFPETMAVLKRLKRRWRLGLVTDGIAAVQRRKIDALPLDGLFDAVTVTDEMGTDGTGRTFWKPHPRAYQDCAAKLGLPVSALAYVGDNPAKDFVTARRLGIFTIRVRRPGTLHGMIEAAPDHAADVEVPDLTAAALVLETAMERGAA